MISIIGLTKDETNIIWSVLHNCWGYPMSKDASILLGFDKGICGELRNRIFSNENSAYQPTEEDKKIILKSFEVFLSEIDEYETVSLTDHTKPEVNALFEKLKRMWKIDESGS